MKGVWENSDENEGGQVCNKLIYLYIDAEKFLGNELSAREIVDAGFICVEIASCTKVCSMSTRARSDFDAYDFKSF